MKKIFILMVLFACVSELIYAAAPRETVYLNGEWKFDQTTKAFPPKKFTRKIPVPGLVHLAEPKISQYDKFFKTDHEVKASKDHNFLDIDYVPMYNWYSRKVNVAQEWKGKKVVLNLLKSQYVTTVYVNGYIAGRAIECFTPLEFDITDYLEYGKENELLIMTGDRAWLPSEVAGGTDKEKVRYLPGIWDDVFLTITGKQRVDDALFLPSLADGKVTVKVKVHNMNPPQMRSIDPKQDSCTLDISIREKVSGRVVSRATVSGVTSRDKKTVFETVIPVPEAKSWSPESPFLYTGEVVAKCNGEILDVYEDNFGMRDFAAVGRYFHLNGQKYFLRGSNVTLHRFFEDPECGNLAWDREWVKKLMIDNPKSIDWNAMRICVGIVPDFWYDLCDEYGIMLQNEWLYWQTHGWNDQIRKEYTDWVWSDGNHPSIVIWDGLNENWDNFIGDELIPELKKLDPTRVWDAGYTVSGNTDEMDEPHPYHDMTPRNPKRYKEFFEKNPYDVGKLDNWGKYSYVMDAGVPQLVNEYGWMWLWRDGRPSKLTVGNYGHYIGNDATPQQRRELQAYWLQMETEWLRSQRVAGVLTFCTLTNNYGFTGDWYVGRIADLQTGPAYQWFKHCFAPVAVFLDLVDGRYTKHTAPLVPGQHLPLHLVGVNDLGKESNGILKVCIYDNSGTMVYTSDYAVVIPAFGKQDLSASVELPGTHGGYLLTAEYTAEGTQQPVISRRYIKVGDGVSW